MQKILIVDDSTLFRKILGESLHSRFPSLMILEAKDGKEALEAIPTSFPDLIFMDIHLGNENGLELTRLIKERFPEIKVVILTSYDLPKDRETAIHYKADHYASKELFISLVKRVPQADNRRGQNEQGRKGCCTQHAFDILSPEDRGQSNDKVPLLLWRGNGNHSFWGDLGEKRHRWLG